MYNLFIKLNSFFPHRQVQEHYGVNIPHMWLPFHFSASAPLNLCRRQKSLWNGSADFSILAYDAVIKTRDKDNLWFPTHSPSTSTLTILSLSTSALCRRFICVSDVLFVCHCQHQFPLRQSPADKSCVNLSKLIFTLTGGKVQHGFLFVILVTLQVASNSKV